MTGPEDIQENCQNCYFFMQTSQNERQQIGYCRANPPAPFFENDGAGMLVPRIARFPVVISNMWCGKWEPNEALLEAAE